MAPLFRITDGTTTIYLNTLPIICTDYPMQSPELDEEVIDNAGDGESISVPRWKNVTETLTLLVTGADAAAIRDSVRSLEALLDKARQNRLTWRGVKVWIEVQFDHDSSTWWRSQILAGRLVHTKIADELWQKKIETSLIITRRYFWEGSETQVQLTSAGTGSPTTGYATIYNNDDASGNTNWFQIAAAQVSGVLPAPLKLEIHNGSGTARAVRSMHLGNYVHMDPTNIDPIMRGEQASLISTSWTGTTENVCYRWLLAKSLLDDLAGQYCRVLVALSTLPSSETLARVRLQYSTGPTFNDLVIGEQARVNGEAVLDLGAMPIPPGGIGMGSNTVTYLTLTMQAPTSAGDSVGVDWLQIMPAGHGLYRQLRAVTPSIQLNDGNSIVDNGIDGVLSLNSPTDTFPIYRGIQTPLHVWPGVTNRFRMMKQGVGVLTAGEAYGVKAWYRPRRLTI